MNLAPSNNDEIDQSQNKAVGLQKRVSWYFGAGIVIVGLVISAVAITPLYLELSKSADKELLGISKINALLIEEHIAVRVGVAQQITSRTRARKLLEDLNQKKIGVDEYQAQSKPILQDALDKTEALIGINRLDATNEKVLSVGYNLPEEFWLIPSNDSGLTINGPLRIDGEERIVFGVPILGQSGERLGTDITLFKLNIWKRIVKDYKGLQETGEIILGRSNGEAADIFYPLRGREDEGPQSFGHEHPISKTLTLARQGTSGLGTYRLSGVDVVIAFAPINGVDWGVLVKMNASEVHAGLNALFMQITAALVGLIILGIYGMHWVLKPLSGSLIMRESELNRQIALKTDKLVKTNIALEKFTYAASHDLKSPLRVIDNVAKWLKESLEPHFTDEDHINMNLLTGRVNRMEALLEDLLIYGRIGRLENRLFQLKTTGKGVLYDVLQQVKLPASFTVSASTAFDSLSVMQMPFERALKILVENAYIHHDRDAGNITLDARDEPGMHVISVKDDGPGIESRYHEKIFELFQTLQPRDKVEGSGMGLAILSRILIVYGGSIEVKSEGRGSEFILRWPKISP